MSAHFNTCSQHMLIAHLNTCSQHMLSAHLNTCSQHMLSAQLNIASCLDHVSECKKIFDDNSRLGLMSLNGFYLEQNMHLNALMRLQITVKKH